MAIQVAQPDTETYIDVGQDSSIEVLQTILAMQRNARVTYDEAAATALELVSFFEAFEDPEGEANDA